MGFTSYCSDTRAIRATSLGYHSAPTSATFKQSVERKAHDEMDSRKVTFRECRDSEAHPVSVPIILALDVTGSMGAVPELFIRDGLPTMMSTLVQGGCPDASLCFVGVGDHECDRYPLQIAQFESGDAELDMWLTRTYLEGGGGGNRGESYPLVWDFAANRVKTDAWDKRKEKGFVFTIGDEPFLPSYPARAFSEIYGEEPKALHGQSSSAEELLRKAEERFNVFHIFLTHGSRHVNSEWKDLLGQRLLIVKDHSEIPALIAKTVGGFMETSTNTIFTPSAEAESDGYKPLL